MSVKRRGNPQNLIKNSERTPEERKALASKAGKASAEKRRRYKFQKEILETLLSKEVAPEMVLETARKMIKGKVTADEALSIVALARALNGDYNFWKEVKDTVEGKETQQVNLSGSVTLTLEDLIKKAEGKSDY